MTVNLNNRIANVGQESNLMAKPTTWIVSNAVPTIHPKAVKPTDIALTVTGSTIVKNGKPMDGHTINLTVAHFRSGAKWAQNEDGTFTITRTEGSRGRKPRTATPA